MTVKSVNEAKINESASDLGIRIGRLGLGREKS